MAKFQGIHLPANASQEGVAIARAVEDWIIERDREPKAIPVFTVATAPPAADWNGCVIGVSDETGGYTLAQSDGTDWLRAADGAVIS